MTRKTSFLWAVALLCVLVMGRSPIASAQYRSSLPYFSQRPYQRQPALRLPNSARHVSGFIGNPYRNDRVTPSGLPVGRNLQSYYGSGVQQSSRGNPFGYRPVQKPFSNLASPRPLITSREAARIEISRGLWLW